MTEYLNEKEFYKTTELPLAGALLCRKYKIEAHDNHDPKKVVFFIKRDEFLDSIIQAYWSHGLLVDPITYFFHLKELKSRIYQK